MKSIKNLIYGYYLAPYYPADMKNWFKWKDCVSRTNEATWGMARHKFMPKRRHKRSIKARDCGRLFGMPECDVLLVRLFEVKIREKILNMAMKIREEKVLNADCESKEG